MRAVRSTIKERRRSRHPFEARPRVNTARGRQSKQPLGGARQLDTSTGRGSLTGPPCELLSERPNLAADPASTASNTMLITKPARPQWTRGQSRGHDFDAPDHVNQRPGARQCRSSHAGGSSSRECNHLDAMQSIGGPAPRRREQMDSKQSRNQPNRARRGPYAR